MPGDILNWLAQVNGAPSVRVLLLARWLACRLASVSESENCGFRVDIG